MLQKSHTSEPAKPTKLSLRKGLQKSYAPPSLKAEGGLSASEQMQRRLERQIQAQDAALQYPDIWAQSNLVQGSSSERKVRRPKTSNEPRKEREVVDIFSVYASNPPLGRMISLAITSLSEQGALLDGGEFGELFIPRSQLAEGSEIGTQVRVFLYKDKERVYATAKRPFLELGEVGRLKVTSRVRDNFYLDLGIPKELLLPVYEQRGTCYEGSNAIVIVAMDTNGRLYASQCLNRFIRDKAKEGEFTVGQKVELVPLSRTPLGYKVVINSSVYGLIFDSEQKGEIIFGKRYSAFIKNVRQDGRVDVTLQEPGLSGIQHAAQDILQALYYSKGHLDFNDKSDPQEIETYLHMSKARFKKAIGSLYKERLIVISDSGIDLSEQGYEHCAQKFTSNK